MAKHAGLDHQLLPGREQNVALVDDLIDHQKLPLQPLALALEFLPFGGKRLHRFNVGDNLRRAAFGVFRYSDPAPAPF